MSLFEKILNLLPDAYKKSRDGVLGKILFIATNEIEKLKKEFEKIEESRRLDKAVGKTLDLHGRDVLAERGGLNDVDYRRFIEIKIIANRSGGEIETLNEVLPVFMMGSFISVRETWNNPSYNYEPAALVIRYDDDLLFRELREEYEETESDPWFFDGTFLFDGTRSLDGGIISYEKTFAKRVKTIERMKRDINLIVAGGVHIYFETGIEVESQVDINQSAKLNISHLTENKIEINNEVGQFTSNLVTQKPVNRFDGAYYFDGTTLFNAERDFIVNDVTIMEVST